MTARERPPMPNFFLVGAFKAGTTSLYHYLRQHPDVYLSPMKEPAYFVSEFRPERLNPQWRRRRERSSEALSKYLENPTWGGHPRGMVTSWDDYLKLFRRAGPEQAIGEGSVGCLWSPTAARRIRERIPGARIVMILRDPSERAFSQYLASSPHVTETFGEAIRRSARLGDAGSFDSLNPLLQFGMYAGQVTRFLDHFPTKKVSVHLHEDLVRDPAEVTRKIFAFLGLRSDVPLDVSRRHNESRVPRFRRLERTIMSPTARAFRSNVPTRVRGLVNRLRFRARSTVKMAKEDRQFLAEHYAEDIRRLEPIIDRDLSSWLVT